MRPIKWIETTEEKYNEMMNVLPPAVMMVGGFLVGEPWDHDGENHAARYEAFVKTQDGKFMVSDGPVTARQFGEYYAPRYASAVATAVRQEREAML